MAGIHPTAGTSSPQGSSSTEVSSDMYTSASGAKRSRLMPRYDLITAIALERLAVRCTGHMTPEGPSGGSLKYGDYNWEKGLPLTDTLNHTIEHLFKFRDRLAELRKLPPDIRSQEIRNYWLDVKGNGTDDDLGAAMWGCMALITYLDRGQYGE